MSEWVISRRGLLISGAAAALLGGAGGSLWLLDLNALAEGESATAARVIAQGQVMMPASLAPFPQQRWHALLGPANLFVLQEHFRFRRGWRLDLMPTRNGGRARLLAVDVC